jgi:hypothetical protein
MPFLWPSSAILLDKIIKVRLYCDTHMEENQNIENQQVSEPTFRETPSGVSFPTVGEQKKPGGAKTFLIIGILILVAILGFVIYKSATKKTDVLSAVEPTPFDNLTAPPDQGVVVATPAPITATPKAADRTGVAIQVQNGTGITGEAAYLQTQLKNLGYTDVKVGNASSQNVTTTTVTFSSSLDSSIIAELTQKFNALYQTVATSNSASTTFDVVVVTGLRKGATPKPSASPSASSSATPTATPTVKPTATP